MATVQAKAHENVLHTSPVELPIVVSKVHCEAVLNTGKHGHELKTKTKLLEVSSNNSWRSKTSSKLGKTCWRYDATLLQQFVGRIFSQVAKHVSGR